MMLCSHIPNRTEATFVGAGRAVFAEGRAR